MKDELLEFNQNLSSIAGVDEAGRGCLAGPVVAAAVILPKNFEIRGLTDSKKISPDKRLILAKEIKIKSLAWSLGLVWPREIERLNILQASLVAMSKSVYKLRLEPAMVLVDGNKAPDISIPCKSIIKGDLKVPQISAASVLAKTFRDQLMVCLDRKYPMYGLKNHKGYATQKHVQSLNRWGPCPLHRYNYRPVAEMLEKWQWLPGI